MSAQSDQLQAENLKREEWRFTVGLGLINLLLVSAIIFEDHWPASAAFRLTVSVVMLLFLCIGSITYWLKLQSIERRGSSVILRPFGIAFSLMMVVFVIPIMLISFLTFAFD